MSEWLQARISERSMWLSVADVQKTRSVSVCFITLFLNTLLYECVGMSLT